MAESETFEALFELIKPGDDLKALELQYTLRSLWRMPRMVWFKQPFHVAIANRAGEPPGRKRLIVPATDELVIVHLYLAVWLKKYFPLGRDFNYLIRGGPVYTVRQHEGPFGITFDLREAFDQITAQRVKNWLRFWVPHLGITVPEEVLDLIIALTTYRGRTPQGCVFTPYAFNLVIRFLDQLLVLLRRFGIEVVTRYSDNVCCSATEQFDFEAVWRMIKLFVSAAGFDISRYAWFDNEPIIYLGTQLDGPHLTLAEDKYGEFIFRLIEAIESPTPRMYFYEVLGLWSWATQVCKPKLPKDLRDLFQTYFSKVGTSGKIANALAQTYMTPML